MRKIIGIGSALVVGAAIAIVLLFLLPASEPSSEPPLEGTVKAFSPATTARAAPEQPFTDGNGTSVSLADFRGKVVLVNLWATWCAPCVKEMPSLDRLQEAMGGDTFHVVALSSDRDGKDKVPAFLAGLGISNLGVYLDPDSTTTRAFGVRGLPTSILIDADGREVGRLEGVAEWDAPEARDLIRFYLERGD